MRYVFDTNVLLNSPHSIFVFNKHTTVIPNHILQFCKGLPKHGRYTVLVRQDTAMRVKADILNLRTAIFRCEKEDSERDQILCFTSAVASPASIIHPAETDHYNASGRHNGEKIVHLNIRPIIPSAFLRATSDRFSCELA